MDMFRAFDQFAKPNQISPAGFGIGMMDIEQHGFVTLDNERFIVHFCLPNAQ
jgi:hypothetical protein